MHVFDKGLIAQCWERTSKALLKARWVDIDKGTRYRRRWVAKQFKGSDSEEWLAATPPTEALRALISHSMSGPKKEALMVCDVFRAFFKLAGLEALVPEEPEKHLIFNSNRSRNLV